MDAIQNFDINTLQYLNGFFAEHNGILNRILAEYLIYTLPFILLVFWFVKGDKKPSLNALFSVILAWPIIATIIGKLVNRPRPFGVTGVQELIFHRPTHSFPSDHAAALFAVAFSLWFSGYKKFAGIMFAYAIVISFFRVATAIHWPTDIIGGLAVGLVAAYLIKLLEKPLGPVYKFIINLAKRIKLA